MVYGICGVFKMVHLVDCVSVCKMVYGIYGLFKVVHLINYVMMCKWYMLYMVYSKWYI